MDAGVDVQETPDRLMETGDYTDADGALPEDHIVPDKLHVLRHAVAHPLDEGAGTVAEHIVDILGDTTEASVRVGKP